MDKKQRNNKRPSASRALQLHIPPPSNLIYLLGNDNNQSNLVENSASSPL